MRLPCVGEALVVLWLVLAMLDQQCVMQDCCCPVWLMVARHCVGAVYVCCLVAWHCVVLAMLGPAVCLAALGWPRCGLRCMLLHGSTALRWGTIDGYNGSLIGGLAGATALVLAKAAMEGCCAGQRQGPAWVAACGQAAPGVARVLTGQWRR